MSNGKLPVVTETRNEDCGGGCDRRTILQGMAVASMVGACRIDVGGDDPASDAPVGNDSGVPGTGFETCGAGMVCVDLTHPMNANLLNVGGSRVIQQGTQKILIGRTDATSFITTSAVCTHAGCTVRYAMATNNITCPCHGSQFALDGTLTRMATGGSPNQADLATFTNTFDEPGNLLTITLT